MREAHVHLAVGLLHAENVIEKPAQGFLALGFAALDGDVVVYLGDAVEGDRYRHQQHLVDLFLLAGFHHPVEDAQFRRRQFAGAGAGALDGPGQRHLVANQVVDVAAKDQFVDGIFLESAAQENGSHPAGEAAEAEEIHIDAGENQRQRPEPVLVQREQENEAVHVGLVGPQEQQQVIF